MTLLEQFKIRVEDFISSTPRMTPTRLGTDACGDPQFVFDLRRGRRPNPDLIEKVDGFMARHHVGDPVKSEPNQALCA